MVDLSASISNDEARLVKSWIEEEDSRLAEDMIAGIPTLATDRATVMFRLFNLFLHQIEMHEIRVAEKEEAERRARRGES